MSIRSNVILLVMSLAVALPANAASRQEKRVSDATDVINQLLQIPEQSVPPSLLSQAYGIAVIPSVVKVGFGLGARRGKGIAVVRQEDGSWSNPAFVTLTGGSIGWQIGAQSTDIILVFKSRRGVDGIETGKLTLGADASIAAGPVGRSAEAATDIQFQAEVYSYSRSRGLFAGISLEGAGLTIDKKSNAAFYGEAGITPHKIFASPANFAPSVANNFVQVLTAQTRRLPKQPGMQPTVNAERVDEQSESSVRTFGIEEAEAPESWQ
ncbi:MAG: lipid-binding SYLF domain-containing protein [Woeseia sp.]|nr:lipid-binding SYLF domain-containing protein [Woeseia sp.]MBT8095915.1 lipid-binding SYLF domain-containing protein [Woeseia sp.]NNE61109.1 lipid-binding SYLF domain-containing protein [Woeseia sp.]NNL54868.1 lipid-binding SYLF domain-containing protein [Woeseia sp.]